MVYEQKLAAAGRALLNQHSGSARAMLNTYLADRDTAQLQRMAMKLAMVAAGSFGCVLDSNSSAAAGAYASGEPPCRDDLRDHQTRKRMLKAVPDLKPLPWLETLQRIAALPSPSRSSGGIGNSTSERMRARLPAVNCTRRSAEPSSIGSAPRVP